MRAGVLVKDGSALERLAEADTVMLDKTGTLTLGRRSRSISPSQAAARSGVAGPCTGSRHPLSEALRRALEKEAIAAAPIDRIENGRLWYGRLL